MTWHDLHIQEFPFETIEILLKNQLIMANYWKKRMPKPQVFGHVGETNPCILLLPTIGGVTNPSNRSRSGLCPGWYDKTNGEKENLPTSERTFAITGVMKYDTKPQIDP